MYCFKTLHPSGVVCDVCVMTAVLIFIYNDVADNN